MTNNSKSKITLLVVVVVVGLVLGLKYGVEYYRSKGTRTSITTRTKGEASAKIKMTEFIDFQCPACAHGAKYIKSFMEEHPGLVQLQMKYYPLRTHRHALTSAIYAECANQQEQFWPYHDKLLQHQSIWKTMNDARPFFDKIAEEVDLEMEKLYSCLNDPNISEIISADKEEGASLGIRSTPSYLINGKLHVGIRALRTELNKYLN